MCLFILECPCFVFKFKANIVITEALVIFITSQLLNKLTNFRCSIFFSATFFQTL
ncbi:Uncharacterised protein [Mycobacterium tuberculosis]|nr:Uncharacterised protein [Mycobacterium tuberculosis]